MTADYPTVFFPALGGTAAVGVARATGLSTAHETAGRIIDQLDRTCSRFRDDSELTALNSVAGSWQRVSPLLLHAVQASLRAARLTGGDVDPTVGRALIALGYDRDFDAIDSSGGTVGFAEVPGWHAVEVDPERARIRLGPGVTLDLGATAKALGADLAAAAAAAAAGCGVVVALSGDVAMAGAAPGAGWRVRVTDDHRADAVAPGQWIVLRSGGLATSSVTTRRWRIGAAEGDAHHLIDPSTARPVEPVWRTVSVAGGSCLDANIASTASIVRGTGAPSWLESWGLPSRLVSVDGTVRHLANWPGAGDDLPAQREPAERLA